MPVNPWPVLIPLFVIWLVVVALLFRWRELAGWLFVAASVVGLIVVYINTGVGRQYDERMKYRLVEIGDYRTVELTTSRGDRISAGTSELVARLRGRTDETVQVSMVGWYDFGRLRGFRVERVDGVSP